MPSADDTATSPSMIEEPVLICHASSAIFLKRLTSWFDSGVRSKFVAVKLRQSR